MIGHVCKVYGDIVTFPDRADVPFDACPYCGKKIKYKKEGKQYTPDPDGVDFTDATDTRERIKPDLPAIIPGNPGITRAP